VFLNAIIERHSIRPAVPTPFDGHSRIALDAYVARLAKYAESPETISPGIFPAALCYVERFLGMNPGVPLTRRNVHRLLLACVVVAIKFFEDRFYKLEFYARVGGVKKGEMTALQNAILSMIDFRLDIAPEEYARYEAQLR